MRPSVGHFFGGKALVPLSLRERCAQGTGPGFFCFFALACFGGLSSPVFGRVHRVRPCLLALVGSRAPFFRKVCTEYGLCLLVLVGSRVLLLMVYSEYGLCLLACLFREFLGWFLFFFCT